MSEESIDAVSQSLSTLTANLSQNQKILEKGSNTLVRWSSQTGKAGQNWTTFSRLTSGTGIWKLQNYIRGTLEVIGKFSDSTKKQIKEQTQNEKNLAATVLGVKKINKEYEELTETHGKYAANYKAKEEELNGVLHSKIRVEQANSQLKKINYENDMKAIAKVAEADIKAHNEKLSKNKKLLKQAKENLAAKKAADKESSKGRRRPTPRKEKNEVKKYQDAIEEMDLIMKAHAKTRGKERLDATKAYKSELASVEKNIQGFKGQIKVVDEAVVIAATYTDTQRATIETQNAYNQAIITGKSEVEAYAAGFKQITENVATNNKQYDEFKAKQIEATKFAEGLKTKKGREGLFGDLAKQQKELAQSSSLLEGMFKVRLKLGSIEKKGMQLKEGATKRILKPKILMDDMKKAGDALSDTVKKGLGKIKNLKNPFSKKARGARAVKKQQKLFDRLKSPPPSLKDKGTAFLKKMDAKMGISVKLEKFQIKFQTKMLAFTKFMKPVLNMAFKFLIFGILGMIALLAVAKIAYDIMGVMAEFDIFDDMKEIFLSAVDILTSVFGIIGSFMSGDFSAMFDYLGTIMSSLMTIGWNLLQIFVKGIFAIAVGIFYSIIDMMVWFVDGGWKVAIPALLKIGVTLVALYFIKYLVSQALLLMGIYALPIITVVLVAALIYAVFRMAYKKFEPVKRAVDFIFGIVSSAWDWITDIWASVKSSINDVLDWFGADTLAKGGLTDGNTTLVGENGPERVRLPAGSRVYSNSQSKSMSGGSTVINNNITINAKDTSDQELRRIAEKIGNMVNDKMNRTISSRTLG